MPRDPSKLSKAIIDIATGAAEPEAPDTRNPAAVALSKLGASKGGVARSAKLSKAKRQAIAKKAAITRWAKRRSSS